VEGATLEFREEQTLKYPKNPFCLIPPSWIIKNEIIASVAVTAILLVNVAEYGINPKKFPNKMKKNNVSKNGRKIYKLFPKLVRQFHPDKDNYHLKKISKSLGDKRCFIIFCD